jgi:nucleotide-binding universal stress UspA family protein
MPREPFWYVVGSYATTMWKHLLVPIDFSECAARALELGLLLAERDRATLTLVHVSPLPPNLPPDTLVTPPGSTARVRIDEYTMRGVRERLDAIAARLRDRGLIDVRTLAVAAPSDDVADELLRVVAEVGVDAIVVGTHGRTGLSHLLLGSVAEKIIRRATIPVITIRSHTAAEAQPTREERVAEDELAG